MAEEFFGWLLYEAGEVERNRHYIDLYFAECARRSMGLELVLAEDLTMCIQGGRPALLHKGQIAQAPRFVVSRAHTPMFSRHLEAMGGRVFNNAQVSCVCNHKMRTYQHVAAAGVPVLDTLYLPKGPAAVPPRAYPFVIKPVHGYGGKNVFWVREEQDWAEARAALGNAPSVVQQVASGVGRDLRVYVMGGRVLVAMLRTAQEGLRSNYNLGGTAQVHSLNAGEEALVKKVMSLFHFDFAGIDFLFDGARMVLNEIEDVVGARMLYAHTDIDMVGRYVKYIHRCLLEDR
jgi:RimK family alpha-L-glutamate ligase